MVYANYFSFIPGTYIHLSPMEILNAAFIQDMGIIDKLIDCHKYNCNCNLYYSLN